MDNHGLRKNCEFEDYASKIFMTGKTAYGSYWNHVNVSQINFNLFIKTSYKISKIQLNSRMLGSLEITQM